MFLNDKLEPDFDFIKERPNNVRKKKTHLFTFNSRYDIIETKDENGKIKILKGI